MFNKGLTTDEKQEGLLKKLKNIEDKTDNLNINAVNDGSRLKKIDFCNPQSDRSRKLGQQMNKTTDEIKKIKDASRDEKLKDIHQSLLLLVQMVILIILINTQI